MLDLEPWDMNHCHPYYFTEIRLPLGNRPIGSYRIEQYTLFDSIEDLTMLCPQRPTVHKNILAMMVR